MENSVKDFVPFYVFCSNASSDVTSNDYWTLYEPRYGIISACILLFYFCIGLPLNFLVGGTLLAKKLYKEPTHIILFSLVLSDSIFLLTLVPQGIVIGVSGELIFGRSDQMRCRFCHVGVIFTWFVLVCFFNVALMSLDRFLFIRMPLHYNMRVTPGRTLVVLAFSWLICIVIAILPLFGLGNVGLYHAFATCSPDFSASGSYYLAILLATAIVPLVVIIVTNVWVMRIVLKNIKAIYNVRSSLLTVEERQSHSLSLKKIMKKKRQKKQLNLMRMLGSLLCANLIAWIPVVIITIASIFVNFDDIPPVLPILTYFFWFSQVVLHPALETAFLRPVKEPIKKIFRPFCLPFKHLVNSRNRDFSVDAENEKPSFCCRCDALFILNAASVSRDSNCETETSTMEMNAG